MDGRTVSKHVFLSYSHADTRMMVKIRSELESMGTRVWTDEGLIPGTESWKTTIEANIRDALGVIVILSPSSNQSLWVERELEYASVHGIRIFPILVQGEPGEAIPIELINAQWIDARDEAKFSSQMQKLALALEGKPGASESVPEHAGTKYPSNTSKPSKSNKNLAILVLIIFGACLICVTTLTILLGPGIMDIVSNNGATPTQTFSASSTTAPNASPIVTMPPPTIETTPPATNEFIPSPTDTIPPPIPTPEITFSGTEVYETGGKTWVRYKLAVENWDAFPSNLFESAPDLPPCGLNTNSSRTWISIYNANDDSYIYGFCALPSPESLSSIWFAVEQGVSPPDAVYVLFVDRRENITYRSNTITIQ